MEMEEIHERIAQLHGVSVDEVKREMQLAIEQAWTDPDRSNEVRIQQGQVCSEGPIPTVEEFVHYVYDRIKDNL